MSDFNDASGTPSPKSKGVYDSGAQNDQSSPNARRVGMYDRPESSQINPVIMIVLVLLAIAAIVAVLYFLKVF